MYNSYRNYRRKKSAGIITVILCFVGMAVLVAGDQLTKLWALSYLKVIDSMPVIGNYVRFTYISNNGAAFNILTGQRVVLIAVSGVLSAVCIYFIVSRRLDSVLADISLTLIATGGIGNLIDRAFRGYVVDFIDFNVIHFAVFNVADSCVTVGVIMLIIFVLKREAITGRRKPKGDIFTRRRF